MTDLQRRDVDDQDLLDAEVIAPYTPSVEQRLADLEAWAFRVDRRHDKFEEHVAALSTSLAAVHGQVHDVRQELVAARREMAARFTTLDARLESMHALLDQISGQLTAASESHATSPPSIGEPM